jgi:hypothetical protein
MKKHSNNNIFNQVSSIYFEKIAKKTFLKTLYTNDSLFTNLSK